MSDDQKRRRCRFSVVFRKPTRSVRQKLASADQQPSTNGKTNTSSISDKTKKRKTLFNSRENSLVVSSTKDQVRRGPKHVQSNSTALITSQGSICAQVMISVAVDILTTMHANQGRGTEEPRFVPCSFGPKWNRGLLHYGWLWNPTSPADKYGTISFL